MHAAHYVRVSTLEQDADLQLVELRRYVAARGWAIGGEFVDRGVSGATSSRAALDQLRSAARRRNRPAITDRRTEASDVFSDRLGRFSNRGGC